MVPVIKKGIDMQNQEMKVAQKIVPVKGDSSLLYLFIYKQSGNGKRDVRKIYKRRNPPQRIDLGVESTRGHFNDIIVEAKERIKILDYAYQEKGSLIPKIKIPELKPEVDSNKSTEANTNDEAKVKTEAKSKVNKVKENDPVKKWMTGELIESGFEKKSSNGKNYNAFFVDIKTSKKVHRFSGVDLIDQLKPYKNGDCIAIHNIGYRTVNVPVTGKNGEVKEKACRKNLFEVKPGDKK